MENTEKQDMVLPEAFVYETPVLQEFNYNRMAKALGRSNADPNPGDGDGGEDNEGDDF